MKDYDYARIAEELNKRHTCHLAGPDIMRAFSDADIAVAPIAPGSGHDDKARVSVLAEDVSGIADHSTGLSDGHRSIMRDIAGQLESISDRMQ